MAEATREPSTQQTPAGGQLTPAQDQLGPRKAETPAVDTTEGDTPEVTEAAAVETPEAEVGASTDGKPLPAPDLDAVDPDGSLRERLAALQQGGLLSLDAVGVAHVERLLSRASELRGPARERLQSRALAYLVALEARKTQANKRAELDVERLERLELDARGRARRALEAGDLTTVRRMARRLPQTEVRLRDKVRKQWEAALDAEVEKRGLTSPGMLDAPSPGDLERAATLEKAVALYRDAMAAAAAELAIARAVEALPIEAGRYHAGSVATRALQAMQDAQPYLRAQLARFETLALLKEYGEAALRAETPQDKPQKGRARKKTAARSGGARKPARARPKRTG